MHNQDDYYFVIVVIEKKHLDTVSTKETSRLFITEGRVPFFNCEPGVLIVRANDATWRCHHPLSAPW